MRLDTLDPLHFGSQPAIQTAPVRAVLSCLAPSSQAAAASRGRQSRLQQMREEVQAQCQLTEQKAGVPSR